MANDESLELKELQAEITRTAEALYRALPTLRQRSLASATMALNLMASARRAARNQSIDEARKHLGKCRDLVCNRKAAGQG